MNSQLFNLNSEIPNALGEKNGTRIMANRHGITVLMRRISLSQGDIFFPVPAESS